MEAPERPPARPDPVLARLSFGLKSFASPWQAPGITVTPYSNPFSCAPVHCADGPGGPGDKQIIHINEVYMISPATGAHINRNAHEPQQETWQV